MPSDANTESIAGHLHAYYAALESVTKSLSSAPLATGSDVEAAKRIAAAFDANGHPLAYRHIGYGDHEFSFRVGTDWEPVSHKQIRLVVHGLDGTAIAGSRRVLRLSQARINAIVRTLEDVCSV